jgi:hypothetical protein
LLYTQPLSRSGETITDEANIRTPARSLSADPKLNGMEQADVDHA